MWWLAFRSPLLGIISGRWLFVSCCSQSLVHCPSGRLSGWLLFTSSPSLYLYGSACIRACAECAVMRGAYAVDNGFLEDAMYKDAKGSYWWLLKSSVI